MLQFDPLARAYRAQFATRQMMRPQFGHPFKWFDSVPKWKSKFANTVCSHVEISFHAILKMPLKHCTTKNLFAKRLGKIQSSNNSPQGLGILSIYKEVRYTTLPPHIHIGYSTLDEVPAPCHPKNTQCTFKTTTETPRHSLFLPFVCMGMSQQFIILTNCKFGSCMSLGQSCTKRMVCVFQQERIVPQELQKEVDTYIWHRRS